MSNLLQGQMDRAEDYEKIAEEHEPGAILNSMVRFKICLTRSNDSQAATEVRKLGTQHTLHEDYFEVLRTKKLCKLQDNNRQYCEDGKDIDLTWQEVTANGHAALAEVHSNTVQYFQDQSWNLLD